MFELTTLSTFEIIIGLLIVYLLYRTSPRLKRAVNKTKYRIKKSYYRFIKLTTVSRGRPNRVNRLIISLINRERKKRRLNPVIYDKNLMLHALQWSDHLSKIGRLEHSATIPENCAMVPAKGSPDSITRMCFRVWMNSTAGHMEWMMDEELPFHPTYGTGSKVAIRYVGFAYHVNGKYAYAALAFGW